MSIEMSRDSHIRLQKAIIWERAKGELRALVAVQGQTEGRMEEFKKLDQHVKDFIKATEDWSLHE